MGISGKDDQLLNESSPHKRSIIESVVNEYRALPSLSAYPSVPIASGERCYSVLEQYKVKSIPELISLNPELLSREILDVNISDGAVFAEEVKRLCGKNVITPTNFNALKRGWTESECMFLWYRVLEEKISEAWFKDKWWYSNGSSQEFVRVMEMQFGFVNTSSGMENFPAGADLSLEYLRMRTTKALKHDGTELRLDTGCLLIADAALELKARGFMPKKLIDNVKRLVEIGTSPRIPLSYAYDLDKMVNGLERIDKGC